jgi:Bacterial Ig-like domain (group 2)/Bacterial Ig-like domain (group 1)
MSSSGAVTGGRLSASGRPTSRGRALVLLAGAMTLASCFDQHLAFGPGGLAQVIVTPDGTLLRVGQQVRLRASPVDSTAALLLGRPVAWSSSAPAVASVSDSGVVIGLAPGAATITAEVDGVRGSVALVVDLAPTIAVSRDSVPFAVIAGQSAQPDSVTVTNAGGFSLVGLTLDDIGYGAGATGWLSAVLSADTAPATLRLMPATAGLTAAGTYRATVPLVSVEADNSPRAVEVVLTVMAAPPSDPAIGVDDADIQASATGDQPDTRATVTVTLLDEFGNPRVGDIVTFTPSDADDFWRVSPADPAASNVDTTDATGSAARTFYSTVAQAKVLTAMIAGVGTKTVGVTVRAAAPASLAVSAGAGQTGIVGAAVAVDPAVLVTDAFGNPVVGRMVSFSVTGGNGSLAGATPTTNAQGVAMVTSWTLGDGATMSGTGTFANGLSASSGALPAVSFSANGIYSYTTHIQPLWAGCLGCHGSLGGLSLAAPSRAALYDVDGVCNPSSKRVAAGGGITAESNSMLMRRLDNTASGISGCTTPMPGATLLPSADRDKVRAWIRNGAPNN